MKVLQFPMVRITLWLVLGILFSYYTNLNPNLAFTLLFAFAIIFIIIYFSTKKYPGYSLIFGGITYVLSFFVGVTTQTIHNDFYQKNNYIHQVKSSDQEHQLTVSIREKLKASTYAQKYIADVKNVDNQESSGRILLNFSKKDTAQSITIGNIIYLKGKIVLHQNPKNPDQFDYGNYLNHKSIFAQMFVNTLDYKVSPTLDKNIFYYANEIRNTILKNLKKDGFKNDELNVIAALILGQKQDLSNEILQDYQLAGAVHILSVSGLHVGYLLLLLNFLTSRFPINLKFNILKLSIILISLWGFAVLAGLSPSVVRSVCMFSILAIGMHLNRKTNIYNTLFISMFFILLFEPSFLFDVGFQLSYAAVFFIIWLYPILSNIWTSKYKLVKYFGSIMAISFSAQMGTLPISLYYFHQFSGLFMITNLVVLPVLGFIMILGIFVMFLAVFNIVPQIPLKILEFCITLLNDFIHWIASFKQFIFRDIPFNAALLITLYLMIIVVAIFSMKPNLQRLKLVITSIILLQTSYFITVYKQKSANELIVFNQKKQTIIGTKDGEKMTLITNDSIENNSMLQSYLVANFNPTVSNKPLRNTIYFNNQKILILDDSGIYPKSIKPDIILITKSPKINFERMLVDLQPKMVIADASNYKTSVERWKTSCIKEKIPFHSTSEKGYYKLK